MKANEYQCSACGNIYTKDWSDEAAQEEYEHQFPKHSKVDTNPDIVCDDCYKQLLAWKSPQEAEQEL